MSQRRRRETLCRVERLEGRAAPSISLVTATIVAGNARQLEVSGTTLAPTVPGNRVAVTIKYQYNMMGTVFRQTAETEVRSVPNGVTNQGTFTLRFTAGSGHTWKEVHDLDPVKVETFYPKTNVVKESEGNLAVTIR